MPYDLETANEVLQMHANFELLPEAFGERCRDAYLAIARNQALQRLVRNDVVDAEVKYNELVANGQIESAIEVCTRLAALRSIQQTTLDQGNALAVSPADAREWISDIQSVVGPRMHALLEDIQSVTPAPMLNHRLMAGDTSETIRASDEEKLAKALLFDWNSKLTAFHNEFGQWISEGVVSEIIRYLERGMSILERYDGLIDLGRRIARLVEIGNRQYAEREHIVDLVEAAQGGVEPWAPRRFYPIRKCVTFGGSVYSAAQHGTSGMSEPEGPGVDGTVSWFLLGPVAAFTAHSLAV